MEIQTKQTGRKLPAFFQHLLSILFWLFIWQTAASILDTQLLLPSPIATLNVLFTKLLFEKTFWLSVGNSFFHIALGFLFGMFAGILLAVCSALCEYVRILFWFPIRLIQSIPVASFVILVLLWTPAYGLATVISFLMVFPILYTHTLTGIVQLDQKLTQAAVLFRVPIWKRIFYIYIPQLLPHICSACILAAGMAWKSGIAAEIIGLSQNTLGNQLYQAKIYLMTPELFAWTLVIVLLSIGCEGLIRLLAKLLSLL